VRKFLLFLIFLFFAFAICEAVIIKVEVKDVCSVEINSLNVSLENLPKLQAEIYNSGSLPYSFRVSVEGENRVWSPKFFEAPGEIKKVSLYFLPSNKTKIKIHFCNKIFEREIEAKEKTFQEGDWFSIKKARVYSNFFVLEVYSNVSTEIVIMPLQYPENLIVESYIGKLKTGKNSVKINFEGGITSERNISFIVASIDGKYFSTSEVKIEKKVRLEYWLFYFLDNIKILSSKF
jgi:hypothetical protein